MKKISTILSTLIAIMGIGGAYASTHQHLESNRMFTIFNWYTTGGFWFQFSATIDRAKDRSGCDERSFITACLRGTAYTLGGTHVVVTLFRNF